MSELRQLERLQQKVRELEAQNKQLKAELAERVTVSQQVELYNAGYLAGHHDTVEGTYVDIAMPDIGTIHDEGVAEIVGEMKRKQEKEQS